MATLKFPKDTPIHVFQHLSALVDEWQTSAWSKCLFLVDYVGEGQPQFLKGRLAVDAGGVLCISKGRGYKTSDRLRPAWIRSLMRLPPGYEKSAEPLLKQGEWLYKDDEVETRLFVVTMGR